MKHVNYFSTMDLYSSAKLQYPNISYIEETEKVIVSNKLFPKNNQIFYTSTDGNIVTPYSTSALPTIVSNTYEDGQGVMTFASDVTTIKTNAFYNKTTLESIVLPESVTEIGDATISGYGNYAPFASCSNLKSVEFPSNLKKINVRAFSSSGLEKIVIPSSVEYIGENAFGSCVTEISFEENSNLKKIEKDAFQYSKFKSITIPKSVTDLTDCFFYSNNLEYIYFEEGINIETFEAFLFSRCEKLKVIEVPKSVKTIKKDCFSYNYALTSLTFEEGIQLEYLSFDGESSGLTSVEIPNTVTYLDGFKNCTSLTSAVIPSSVTEIGSSLFVSCKALTSVTFEEGSQIEVLPSRFCYCCSNLNNVVIPSTVKRLNTQALANCSKLSNLTINIDNIEYLGTGCFRDTPWYITYSANTANRYENVVYFNNIAYDFAINMEGKIATFKNDDTVLSTNLTSKYPRFKGIILPNNMTRIEDNHFRGLGYLETIELPNKIEYIGTNAFSGCTSLQSIEIPSGVTEIGESAFYDCSGLTSVTFAENSQLTTISGWLFRSCSSLTSIEIPKNVTSIGNAAFYYCTSLTSITFEEGTQIEKIDGINKCTSLTSFVVPNGATNVGDFSWCSGLIDLTLPSSVTKFSGVNWCTSLANINYDGTSAQFKAISKDSSWKIDVPSTCIVHCTDGDFPITQF